jgi:hypothetical protein
MTTSIPVLVVHSVGRGHAVATLSDRLVIGYFVKTPVVATVQDYHRAGQAAARAHPGGIAFLTISDKPGSPPDGATRAVFGSMLRDFGKVSRASALAVLGASPLATSVVRGVMTNVMLLVSQPAARLQMFDQVEEAGRWLQKECGPRGVKLPDAADVEAAVRDIRAQMSLHP